MILPTDNLFTVGSVQMESPSTPELVAHLRGGCLFGSPPAGSLKVKDIVSRDVPNLHNDSIDVVSA